MSIQRDSESLANAAVDGEVAALYRRLLETWNRRDAAGYAALFDEESYVVGFDGSPMVGRAEIEASLRQIFESHMTATYVGKIRGVRALGGDVGLLRAVVGMVPPGGTDINPAVNAMQTLVAVRTSGEWRIAQFQNTPAQFHGRPEVAAALTEELRQLL